MLGICVLRLDQGSVGWIQVRRSNFTQNRGAIVVWWKTL